MKKIKYTKERLNNNLRMGVSFISIGIILVLISLRIEEWKEISIQSLGIGQFGAGFFILILYSFEKRKQYLSIENGEITKNTLFPKRIKLNEIKSISEFAGDLKLNSDNKEFVIDTQIIDSNSLKELKSELKIYNLK